MSANTKIFQIYYKPEQLQELDPDLVPCDNTDNLKPELREWYVWDRDFDLRQNDETCDLYGYVSWKFKEKLGLSGRQMLDWIASNPGHDVYLINPCIINEAVFANSWEQGDLWHPEISSIGDKFLAKLGYEDVGVRSIVIDRRKTVYANYIVGSKAFWNKFMTFSRRLFTEAETDPVFKEEVFGTGRSQYSHDPSLPNFTFLIERLIPIFIELEDIDAVWYEFTKDTAQEKYREVFDEIRMLSDLKVAINDYESDELYNIWNYYRVKFLQTNQGILGLE